MLFLSRGRLRTRLSNIMPEFQATTQFLLALAKQAGEIMLKYYSPAGVKSTNKENNSPVTQADLEINSLVISEVAKNYPEFRVLAEEESNNEASSKKLFVVDPLDGTLMFTIGAPAFCFSAAVVLEGKSVAGVLFNPLAKRTLVAELGKGAWLVEENKQIFVSQRETLNGAIINTGWRDSRAANVIHARGGTTPVFYSICEWGSLIATGGLDGGIFTGIQAHDLAAVKVIVEEAGGKVTNINGQEQRYDQNVCGGIISNNKLHDQLLAISAETGVAQDVVERYKNLITNF